ncbi:holes in muscle isoform 2-T2 [Glossina fuscipes fuscipes]
MGIMYKLMKQRKELKNENRRMLTMDGNIIERTDVTANETEDKHFTAEHILQLCKFLAEKSKTNKNLHKQQQTPKKFKQKYQENRLSEKNVIQPREGHNNNNNNNSNSDSYYIQQQQQQQQHEQPAEHQRYQLQFQQQQQQQQQQHEQQQQQKQQEQQQHQQNMRDDIKALSHQEEVHAPHTVLVTDLSKDFYHVSANTNHTCCRPLQQHKRGKHGDILLKIRHQIFERKRLREQHFVMPLDNTAQVWRPW